MLDSLRGQAQTRRQFLRRLGILGAGAAMGDALMSLAQTEVADGMQALRMVSDAGRKVCLTYDDLWNEYYTLRIAKACHRRGIRLTFFPIGRAVLSNVERPHKNHEYLYPRLREMGHEIGCHLYTHRNIRKFSLRRLIDEEMEPALDILRRALGQDFAPVGVRPPYGLVTDPMRELAELYGIPLVLWSVDSQDALCTARLDCDKACGAPADAAVLANVNDSEPQQEEAACAKEQCAQKCVDHILDSVERQLKPGSVILNHSIKNAWLALPGLLQMLQRRDLQPVSLSELMAAAG